MKFIGKNWKGILVCLCIAVPGWFFGNLVPVVGGPVFAIVVGMVISLFWKDKKDAQTGIAFTSKKILQYAVILLGFGLNITKVLEVGKQSLPIILATVFTSLIIAFVLCKVLKVPSKTATLVGVGSSICGGSAIAATAPVIGADDEEIAQSISVIFLFNVIAAIIFPTLGGLLGLTNEGFGLFAGTAVNDTSSVTAAASSWDSIHGTGTEVLDRATIVKLTRTLAIIPITVVLALWRTRKEKASGGTGSKVSIKKVFPMFILWFVVASLFTTLVSFLGGRFEALAGFASVMNTVFSFLKNCSKFFIIMAMAAIGLNTDIIKLVKTGGKPILLGFCCWVGITGVSLLMQHVLGIW